MLAKNEVQSRQGRRQRRYAVIGAGSSGLCCAKYLTEAGFNDVTIFELGSNVGGLWCYENDSGTSGAYKSLHINTPKNVTNFYDFPFRSDAQLFPSHWEMHQYFKDYADHFDIMRRIRFNTRIVDVRPAPDYSSDAPQWEVEIEGGAVEEFDCVMVANGHLTVPRHISAYKDNFSGQYVHSSAYREPAPYVGKRVCLVGVGNSGMDIAADLCMIAQRFILVARSGVLITPKVVAGIPLGSMKLAIEKWWIPSALQLGFVKFLAWLFHGKMSDLGFKPLPRRAHGTQSCYVPFHIQMGDIAVKQGIERIEGQRIHFVDGTSEVFDVMVAATGYRITMEFLSDNVISINNDANSVDLYKRIVPPVWRGLYVIGMLNTNSISIPHMAELQMKWILAFEKGEAMLPSEEEMWADIRAKQDWLSRTYLETPRHGIEEPHTVYTPELTKSLNEAKKRMQREGTRPGGSDMGASKTAFLQTK